VHVIDRLTLDPEVRGANFAMQRHTVVSTVVPALEDASIPVPFMRGYQCGSFEKANSPGPALSAAQQNAGGGAHIASR
jgi:hypothetical protein